MRRLLKLFWFVLAVLFLVEAWLWDRLAPVIAAIVRLLPWVAWKATVAAAVERLPPLAAAALFAVPAGLLLPVKFLALWLFAQEHWISAVALLVLAKILGLGVTAFLFDLCRDKLLLLPWFAWVYVRVLALRDWAHRETEPARRAIRAAAAGMRRRLGLDGRLRRRLVLLRLRARRFGRAT
ncbi:hypothetical protein QNA08_03820 [Chelatococcus sp. SYSU_G07232]|uniref:Transmembrane protein n=1 Tax=Chelatococcus albus TaxID=3047466 RepID=A0ABT7ADB5_9HYPH|nr:hypothetical protein [Chelatococcus sp. SYSU_G07232]MDJ1157365.1 hypothetical protein [Chelatococcus sp. SYSU_G07232]